jgi:fibronectin type 3 domain-containing protein/Na+-transporting methylmalonyl-CoA/oxaloacetate decarboxylase gamma subunit
LIFVSGQLWYNDTSVTDGITYIYNVTAVNAAGEGPNSTIFATPGVTTAPSEPLNLQAESGDEYVNLTWDAPASDGGSTILWYYIYRNDTAGVYNVVVGSQLYWNDTLVTNGESYTYNVTAENAIGLSPNSTDVAGDPLGFPSAPQNPDIISQMDLLNITWETPSDDGGTPIIEYNIYRNGTAGIYVTIPAGQLWYNDTNVLNNTMYTYNITAVNAKGEGPAALIFGTPLTTPTAPRNLAAEAGAGYVLLTWDIPLNNGSSDITTYIIYRNDTNGTFGIAFGNQLSFNDTNAENGVNYTYHITAVNAQGESPNSTNVSARPESPPYVIDSFIVIAGNGFVNLSWDEPFDGGSPITEYFVYKNGTTGPYVTLPVGQLSYNDTDVTNGVIYTYFISANNSLGEGAETEETSIMAGAVPSPPRIVLSSLLITASSVTFSWSVPLDDGGMPITNYKVYKGTVSGDWTVYQPFTTSLTYTDNTVTPGFTYYYVVTAENFVGESKFSNEASAIPLGPPDMPTEVTIFAGNGYVILTWKIPFTDGGSPLTNYRIYRGTSSDTIPFFIDAGNVLSYNDTQVTNDVTYFYVISAENIEGEGIKTEDLNATPMAPVELVNKAPTVAITTPSDGVRWAQTATISGTAFDSDGEVEKVEIRFNDGEWLLVNGTDDWSYEVNPKDLPNGENIIYARSFDGENYSNEVDVTVTVDISEDDGDDEIVGVVLMGIAIILLIIVVLFLLMFFMKRRPEREYEEEEDEEEEEEEDEEEEEEEEEEEDEEEEDEEE